MSKRAFKKYISELEKEALEEQLMDLYERYPEVKTFYDFAFNPKEDKLIDAAKVKISHEYFPKTRRKARKRRSVAQKFIKHFKTLGVDPYLIADVMLYNIEIAQTYTASNTINQESFYKSMYNSFQEILKFVTYHGIKDNFLGRIEKIVALAEEQRWPNAHLLYEQVDLYLS